MKLSLRVIILTVIVALSVNCTLGNWAFAAEEGTVDPYSGKPCYRCHLSIVTGPGVHGALKGNRCSQCHKLSNGNHQLNHRFSEAKDRTARLCYECHPDQSSQKSVHPPIIENDCFGCHVPHTSADGNLLKIPMQQLCFQCHERALLNEETTDRATAFRDGSSNLHYLHGRKSDIPCLACHQAHASSQEYLLRSKGGSGKDPLTLTYRATPTGGNCTSSCHGTAAYAR